MRECIWSEKSWLTDSSRKVERPYLCHAARMSPLRKSSQTARNPPLGGFRFERSSGFDSRPAHRSRHESESSRSRLGRWLRQCLNSAQVTEIPAFNTNPGTRVTLSNTRRPLTRTLNYRQM